MIHCLKATKEQHRGFTWLTQRCVLDCIPLVTALRTIRLKNRKSLT